MKKYFSYSEFSCFFWNKDEYYKRYILGEQEEPNEKMKIGKIIHSYLEDNYYPLTKEFKELGLDNKRIVVIKKMLDKIEPKLLPEHEKIIFADLKGINLMAIFDGFDKRGLLDDYKTTDEHKWEQWKVDYNKQMSFYALVYKLCYHKYFRQIRIWELNTIKGTVKHYETARGPRDLKYIEAEILRAIYEIKNLNWWERRLSRKEREMKNQIKMVL
jgi:CRISPR/Cas system-associated exonuclease Cas4 (RecB family)